MDISLAKELLGYEPEDDFVDSNPALRGLKLNKNVRLVNELVVGHESGLKTEQS